LRWGSRYIPLLLDSFPTPFIKETILSPLHAPGIFAENQLTVIAWFTTCLSILFHQSVCLFFMPNICLCINVYIHTYRYIFIICVCVVLVLGREPRVSHMLGKWFSTELHLQPYSIFWSQLLWFLQLCFFRLRLLGYLGSFL
jgi:hypothetical protein